jgi:hypothetical protein
MDQPEIDRIGAYIARNATYAPNPAEEAWYASATGLRVSAKNMRFEAWLMVEQAQEMERRADALERTARMIPLGTEDLDF